MSRTTHYAGILAIAVGFQSHSAAAAMLENAVTIPHSTYVQEDNPPCGPAGSSCRTLCVDFPWNPNAKFQTYMSGIPGRGPGNWTPQDTSPSASNGRWEWGAATDSQSSYNGSTGKFCSTGKNWSHNTDREFRVRVIY